MKLLPAWKIFKVDNYAMGRWNPIWDENGESSLRHISIIKDNQSSGCIIRPLHDPYDPWQWHASNFSWHHRCWIKHWGHEKLQAFFTRPDPNLSHFFQSSATRSAVNYRASSYVWNRLWKKKDHPQKKNSPHEYHGKYMEKSRENTLTDKN